MKTNPKHSIHTMLFKKIKFRDTNNYFYRYVLIGNRIKLNCINETLEVTNPLFIWSHTTGDNSLDNNRYSKEDGQFIISDASPVDSGEYQCIFKGFINNKITAIKTHHYLYVYSNPAHYIVFRFISPESCSSKKKISHEKDIKEEVCPTRSCDLTVTQVKIECIGNKTMNVRLDVLLSNKIISFSNKNDCNVKCASSIVRKQISTQHAVIAKSVEASFTKVLKDNITKLVNTTCDSGYELFESVICIPCTPQFFSNDGSKCIHCPRDTYQLNYTSSYCVRCSTLAHSMDGCELVVSTPFPYISGALFVVGFGIAIIQCCRDIFRINRREMKNKSRKSTKSKVAELQPN